MCWPSGLRRWVRNVVHFAKLAQTSKQRRMSTAQFGGDGTPGETLFAKLQRLDKLRIEQLLVVDTSPLPVDLWRNWLKMPGGCSGCRFPSDAGWCVAKVVEFVTIRDRPDVLFP